MHSSSSYPGLATASQVDRLYDAARARLADVPGLKGGFEYRGVSVPRERLREALAREATLSDRVYAAYGVTPRPRCY